MNISTKGLKKVAQNDKTTTLQHPDGHQVVIAHSKLKPEHAAALLKLPMHKHDSQPVQKFASGGTAQPEPTAGSSSATVGGSYTPSSGSRGATSGSSTGISGASIMHPSTWYAEGGDVSDSGVDVGQMAADTQNNTPVQDPAAPDSANGSTAKLPGEPGYDGSQSKFGQFMAWGDRNNHNAPQSPATDPNTASSAPADDQPNPLSNVGLPAAPGNNMITPAMPGTKGIDGAIAGYNTLAKNQAATDAATQPMMQQNADAQQQLSDTFQSHIKELNTESASAYQAFQDGHIDPDHYMKSLSTGGKVSTAIGLILGGIGGGMTHQANPALEFLNKQIDRDIDGQKANLGKQATLFSMLKEKMGSEIAGTAAAKGMMTDALIAKIQAEAAKRGGSDAMAKAQIAIAPLQQQKDQFMQQAAMMKSAGDMLTSGGNINPAIQGQATRMYLQAAGARPEDIGKAEGELAEVQGVNSLQGDYQNAYKQLNSMALAGALTPAKRAALTTPIVNQLQMSIDHRFNESAAEKLQEALFPAKFDAKSSDVTKNDAAARLFETARSKAAPTLNSYGVPIPKPKPMGTKINTIK